MVYASLLFLAGSLQAAQPVQAPDEIIGFDLGPCLRLSQSAEYGWRFIIPDGQAANLKKESIAISVAPDGYGPRSTWFMPFLENESNVANVSLWPYELSGVDRMIAEYIAREKSGLWFKKQYEKDVKLFHTDSRYLEAPRQRYVVTGIPKRYLDSDQAIENARPRLLFTDEKGKSVPDLDLLYRIMILDSIEPTDSGAKKYTFRTELEPIRKVVATGTGAILRYANIDAITSSSRVPKEAWYRGPGVPILAAKEGWWGVTPLPERKIKILGVYTLFKGRILSDTPFDFNTDTSVICMQPVMVTFEPPKGLDFSVLVDDKIQQAELGMQALILKTSQKYRELISEQPPSNSGFKPGSKWEKALGDGKVIVGMTREMVEWVWGQPLRKSYGDEEIWHYLDSTPFVWVSFKQGKVVEVYIGTRP